MWRHNQKTRQISAAPRSPLTTEQVPGQPGLHMENKEKEGDEKQQRIQGGTLSSSLEKRQKRRETKTQLGVEVSK